MGAALHLVGDLPLVTPRPVDELHPRTLKRIDEIEAAVGRGDRLSAARLALRLEVDMGITTEDRIAAMTATNDWEQQLEGALQRASVTLVLPPPQPKGKKRRKAAPEPAQPSLQVALPAHERGRAAADIDRFDKLRDEIINRERLNLKDEQVEIREKQLAALEAKPAEDAAAAWQKAAADETETLAKARGVQTAKSPSGRLEIISHDPLRRLLHSGKLTADQHEAGLALRDAYEARSGDAGSQMGKLLQTATAHDNDKYVKSRLTRAKATDRVQAVELAVLTGLYRLPPPLCGRVRIEAFGAYAQPDATPPHVALTVLRNICAHNIGLTEQGRGRAFDRNSKALLIALDIAHECLMGGRAKRP